MASETRMYNGNYNIIFRRSLNIINNCGWNVVSYDENKGLIIAQTETNILSWGEKVSIKISKKGNGAVVEVISEPVAQLIDWGKSKGNIQTFYNWFEKI